MLPVIPIKKGIVLIVFLAIIHIALIVTTIFFSKNLKTSQEQPQADPECFSIGESGKISVTGLFSTELSTKTRLMSTPKGNINNKLFSLSPDVDVENIRLSANVFSEDVDVKLTRLGDLSNVVKPATIALPVDILADGINYLEITTLNDSDSFGYLQPRISGFQWQAASLKNTFDLQAVYTYVALIHSVPKIIFNEKKFPVILCTEKGSKEITVISALDNLGKMFDFPKKIADVELYSSNGTYRKQIAVLQKQNMVALVVKTVVDTANVNLNVLTSADGFETVLQNTIVTSVPVAEIEDSPCLICEGTTKGSIFVGFSTKKSQNILEIYLASSIASPTFALFAKIEFAQTLFSPVRWDMGYFESTNEVVVVGIGKSAVNRIFTSKDSFSVPKLDPIPLTNQEFSGNSNINITFSEENNVPKILFSGSFISNYPFVIEMEAVSDSGEWISHDVVPRGLFNIAYGSCAMPSKGLYLTNSYDNVSRVITTGFRGGISEHAVNYTISST